MFSLTLEHFYSEPHMMSEWKRGDTPQVSQRSFNEENIFGDQIDFESTLNDFCLDGPNCLPNYSLEFKEEECLDLDVFLEKYN